MLPERVAFADRILARLEELTDGITVTIFAEIPSYGPSRDDRDFFVDVRQHVERHIHDALEGFAEGRPVVPQEFAHISGQARRRVGRIPVADFMLAFQTAHVMLFDEIADNSGEDPGVVMDFGRYLARYFGTAAIHASEAYMDAQALVSETSERQRRDLLEELLAGGYPSGPRLIIAVEAGLLPSARLVVISARLARETPDADALRVAARGLVRATRAPVRPLSVVRRDEVVIVLPVRENTESDLVGRMAEAQRALAEHELVLSVGISTVRSELIGVADAYREATDARERLAITGGVLGLPALSALDYVAAINQPGLRRLISDEVRAFIEEDAAKGGALLDTLHAYTATSLNVARTADRLGIHVNTAHYRLGKIADRTGLDLRSVEDVMELVLAVRSLSLAAQHQD